MYRFLLQKILDLDIYRPPGNARRMLMRCGVLGPGGRSSAQLHADSACIDHPQFVGALKGRP